jgi:hypothetical protein
MKIIKIRLPRELRLLHKILLLRIKQLTQQHLHQLIKWLTENGFREKSGNPPYKYFERTYNDVVFVGYTIAASEHCCSCESQFRFDTDKLKTALKEAQRISKLCAKRGIEARKQFIPLEKQIAGGKPSEADADNLAKLEKRIIRKGITMERYDKLSAEISEIINRNESKEVTEEELNKVAVTTNNIVKKYQEIVQPFMDKYRDFIEATKNESFYTHCRYGGIIFRACRTKEEIILFYELLYHLNTIIKWHEEFSRKPGMKEKYSDRDYLMLPGLYKTNHNRLTKIYPEMKKEKARSGGDLSLEQVQDFASRKKLSEAVAEMLRSEGPAEAAKLLIAEKKGTTRDQINKMLKEAKRRTN